MKKNYLLIIGILFLVFNLNAQITLTSSTCTPQPDDEVVEIEVSDSIFDINLAGPNVTWDFSSAVGVTKSFDYIAVNEASDTSSYLYADVVEDRSFVIGTVQFLNERYFSTSETEIAELGRIGPGYQSFYTDKREIMKFPITYNDVFSETFSGTATETTNFPFEAEFTYSISGTISISADGYGTLMLPDTTVNDVLFIRTIYEYTDSSAGEYHEITDTISYWYDTIQSSPLVTSYISYINGNEDLRATYLIKEFEVYNNNQVSTADLELNTLSVYPNPANDFVIVENIEDNSQPIDIYDLRGVRVKTAFSIDGKAKIDIANLSSGVYFIKYIKDSHLYTEKLVVEK